MSNKKVAAITDSHGAESASQVLGGNFNRGGKLISKWDVTEVCDHFRNAGFADLVPAFQKHQVSGAVMPKLNDSLLKEMGIDIIGRRVLLMNEVNKIQAISRAEWRNQAVWASPEYREGPCNNALPFGFPCCAESCTGLPDTYTVTNSKINITSSKKNVNTPCTGCCGYSVISENTDLSDVTDVDVSAASAMYGDPAGRVTIVTTRGVSLLTLKSSECQKTAALITNAKEEAASLAPMMAMAGMMR